MRKGMLLFLLGVYGATWQNLVDLWFPGLLPLALAGFLLLLSFIANAVFSLRPVALLTLAFSLAVGFAYGAWAFQLHKSHWLQEGQAGTTFLVRGEIASMPVTAMGNQRFLFEVQCSPGREGKPCALVTGTRIYLSWDTGRHLVEGDAWQLRVKLKPPHGFYNPGTFDYEKWLFEKGIQAKGYVKPSFSNQFLYSSDCFAQCLRSGIREQIRSKFLDGESDPLRLVAGLVVGDRSALVAQQRRVLQDTGTAHLLAISGLHVGLVFSCCLLLLTGMLRLPVLSSAVPFSRGTFAALAFSAAVFYSAIAGFSLPTQRAVFMLGLVVVTGRLMAWLRPVDVLLGAVFFIVLASPSSIASPGLWLSAFAVLVVLTVFATDSSAFASGGIRLLVISHWRVCLFMLAPGIAVFGKVSLVSFLANLFAIPYVSFFLLPLSLFLSILEQGLPAISVWAEPLLRRACNVLFVPLDFLSQLPGASLEVQTHYVLLFVLGLLLLKFGVHLFHGLVVVVLIAVFALAIIQPVYVFRPVAIHVLDVGQGTAVILQDGSSGVVYDAGPAFRGNFDVGESIIIPVLKNFSLIEPGLLVISHDDDDHWGGAGSIVSQLDIPALAGSGISHLRQLPVYRECRAGMKWNVGGWRLRVLWPSGSAGRFSDNNRSCVIEASHGDFSILLAGDIERQVEAEMVARGLLNESRLLLVPHHGSNTSSSYAFLKTVKPDIAVYSAGYLNPFGHPAEPVTERYRKLGIKTLSTQECGMISFWPEAARPAVQARCWRRQVPRVWHRKRP